MQTFEFGATARLFETDLENHHGDLSHSVSPAARVAVID